MRNVPLLTEIRDIILAEPEKHDQQWWATLAADALSQEAFDAGASAGVAVSCTTACCVAGFACMLSGDQAYVYSTDLTSYAGKRFYSIEAVLTTKGNVRTIDDRAQELLGITWGESEVLFASENSRDYTLTLLNALINDEEIYDEFDGWLIES